MQLTKTILGTRRGTFSLEFTILLFLTQNTKRSSSQFRAHGRNGKSNSQTTVKEIQRILHGIRFVSEYLELSARTQIELQRVQVNQCRILRGIAKKCRPFWY